MDLLTIHIVSAVSTQGAVIENSWVSSYLVHYSLDGNDWIVFTDKGGEIKVCFSTVHILLKLHYWLIQSVHILKIFFSLK